MSETSLNWSDAQLTRDESEADALRKAYELGAPICYHVDPKLPVVYDVEMTVERLNLLRGCYIRWRPVGKITPTEISHQRQKEREREQRRQKFIDDVLKTMSAPSTSRKLREKLGLTRE
jgi:hypothetical protein